MSDEPVAEDHEHSYKLAGIADGREHWTCTECKDLKIVQQLKLEGMTD